MTDNELRELLGHFAGLCIILHDGDMLVERNRNIRMGDKVMRVGPLAEELLDLRMFIANLTCWRAAMHAPDYAECGTCVPCKVRAARGVP